MATDQNLSNKACTCGRSHSPAEWEKLQLVGVQHTPADEHGPEEKLELRNCQCGSTLAVELPAEV